jgi:hypothetical protein
MANDGDDCLDRRLSDIHAMIGGEALFQASAAINGGRRCAAMQTCAQWHDCAWAHGALWGHVTDILTRSK